MSAGIKYVNDLLGDRFDVHSTTGTDTGLPPSFDPVADRAENDARKQELAEVRTRIADDPQAVLDQFREFFHDSQLTLDDVQQYIDTWQFAVDHPEAFSDAIETGQPSFGIGDWFSRVRAYLHQPKDVSSSDQAILDELRRTYELPDDITINPSIRQFEKYDPSWVKLLNAAIAEKRSQWLDLQPFRSHEAADSKFIYPARLAYGAGIKIGLFADFGTGYYHSRAIARQLEAHAYSYVFHLGDVYYAGRPDEFKSRFKQPLANVVKRSRLFGLAENHELYTGGKSYLGYFDELRQAHAHQQQEGSYFCVSFDKHQIIGIDVNWNGRQAYLDPKCRDWLAAILSEANGRTNILLSGSAPYGYPSKDRRRLLADLWPFVRDGQIHLWFWGDDHYCALFARHPTLAPFIGSCIGHGGYPGSRMEPDRECWAKPLWVEDEPRFPAWTRLRQDAGNNGWCEATLLPDGSVELLYVDWLSAKRHRVVLQRIGNILQPTTVGTFGGRGERTTVPTLHRPA
jgi:hypothetical protein